MDLLPSDLSLSEYQFAVEDLEFGKRLPGAVYVFEESTHHLPAPLGPLVILLRNKLELGNEFNVLKFSTRDLKISFLSYPKFHTDPHPSLAKSVSVNLVTGKVKTTEFSNRSNPPILHRKETFLPPDHPRTKLYTSLTESEEEIGLYENTSTIGFKLNWDKLVRSKRKAYRGHQLVDLEEDPSPLQAKSIPEIERHRAAISRSEFSRPIKLLLDHGLIRKNVPFFDYGCGLGDDVSGLNALEFDARGWDPYFAPQAEKVCGDVVNLGFVLNVIEDPAERVEVLVDAWRHTQKLLVVSTLITGRENYSYADRFGDGLITNRKTFQKHYEPEEFTGLLEHALDVEPISVDLGVCFVFKKIEDQQDFLSQRSHRHIDWERINQKLRVLRPKRVRLSAYDRNPELMDSFWRRMLELGRLPKNDEFEQIEEVRALCQSPNKAAQLFIDKFGEEPIEEARQRRKEDLLVYLSGGEFQRRRTPFAHLSSALRRDIKTFFGHYAHACDQAKDLLFAAGDSDEIELALEGLEFGWFDEAEGHFTIHRSLIPELPPILRIYIECAARLFGDPDQADLIKLHVYSGKLTFQHYDDFDKKTLPELEIRIKVDLRRRFVNVIDHTNGRTHQILFFKERFLPAEYTGRKSMERYSSRLRKLGITEAMLGSNDQGAPSREEFEAALEQVGLTKGLSKKKKAPS